MQLTSVLMILCGALAIQPAHELATAHSRHSRADAPAFILSDNAQDAENCLTGENQCKAYFDVTSVPTTGNPGCAFELRIEPGDTMTRGSCKCEGDPEVCKKDVQCKFDGTVQGRVTTANRILTSGTDCGETNNWIDLYTLSDQSLDRNSEDDTTVNFACYLGTCENPGAQRAVLFVRSACKPCDGVCPSDPD